MRVMWLLEELDCAYDYTPAPPQSEAARAFEPTGKVPILIADGQVLTESVAILTFLADRHGLCTYPAGTVERARQDGFTQFCVDCVEGALWTASKHRFVLPEALRVPEVKQACRHDFAQAMAILEQRLGASEFVMGERFTIPDILFGHAAGWARAAKFDLPEGPVGAYLARITARPALARAMRRGAAASDG